MTIFCYLIIARVSSIIFFFFFFLFFLVFLVRSMREQRESLVPIRKGFSSPNFQLANWEA